MMNSKTVLSLVLILATTCYAFSPKPPSCQASTNAPWKSPLFSTPPREEATSLSGGVRAIRATGRAATGVSATAVYYSFLAFTSGAVRNTMKLILSIFPTWIRYFFQPLLVLYYVPLYMLRSWTSPKKRQERKDMYDDWVGDWNKGIQAAEAKLDELAEDELTA